MKRSAKVTPFVLAWAMSSVVGPQAAAQTQPANPGTPPAAVETPQPTPAPAQQQKQTQQQAVAKQLRLTPMQERRMVPILRTEALKVQGIKNNQSLSQSQKSRRIRAVQNRSNRKLRVILTRSQFQQLQSNRQQRAQLMQAALQAKNNQGKAARSAVPPVPRQ